MPDRPLIVVTNDDGYLSHGLSILADRLESLGEVWVVAPERARSAVSHAISLHKPLRLHEYDERRFWCSGTPTDSVYIAVNHVLPRAASLLVSGINIGANLGDDVTYSGTVAGAMEGTLMGVPSLAVSLCGRAGKGLEAAAEVSHRVAALILARGLPEGTLLNLNVPSDYDPGSGVAVCRLGKRNYGRVVVKNVDPRGRDYYWIGGPDIGFGDVPGSDCNAIRDGRASLTPVHLDLTNHSFLEPLAGLVGESVGSEPAPRGSGAA